MNARVQARVCANRKNSNPSSNKNRHLNHLPDYQSTRLQPLGISPRMTSNTYPNGRENAPPVPPLPKEAERKESMDPYARSESMTHRRSSHTYATRTVTDQFQVEDTAMLPSVVSSVNSPRRVRKLDAQT